MLPAILAIALAGASPAPVAGQSKLQRAGGELSVATVAPGVLRLEGEIEEGDGPKLIAALGPETHTLLVNSVGGEVSVALDMAEALERRRVRVVVDGFCVSSCANYLFAAGAQRIVWPGGVLLWHGGPTPENGREMEAGLRATWAAKSLPPGKLDESLRLELGRHAALMRRQDALYARRGLNTAILYKLNNFQDYAPVAQSTENKPASVIFVGFDALACAGFDVRQAWAPADAPGWTAFLKQSRMPTHDIQRSAGLERALCAKRGN